MTKNNNEILWEKVENIMEKTNRTLIETAKLLNISYRHLKSLKNHTINKISDTSFPKIEKNLNLYENAILDVESNYDFKNMDNDFLKEMILDGDLNVSVTSVHWYNSTNKMRYTIRFSIENDEFKMNYDIKLFNKKYTLNYSQRTFLIKNAKLLIQNYKKS